MTAIVEAIEATAQLPGYRRSVLSWAPEVSQADHGPAGVLMGYDFHLNEEGPKLIEINTNAGGAFLNVHLARAQAACCADVKIQHRLTNEFDERIVAMVTGLKPSSLIQQTSSIGTAFCSWRTARSISSTIAWSTSLWWLQSMPPCEPPTRPASLW